MIRDPVARTVSAFNYVHPVYGSPIFSAGSNSPVNVTAKMDEAIKANPGFAPFVECFSALPGGVNDWAEALSDDSLCGQEARRVAYNNEIYGFLDSDGKYDGMTSKHVVYNHLWYLSSIFRGAEPSDTVVARVRRGAAHILLVRTEDIDNDMARVWDFLCVPESQRPPVISTNEMIWEMDYPRHNDTTLSARGRANLEAFNRGDQYVLDELEAYDGLPVAPRHVPDVGRRQRRG